VAAAKAKAEQVCWAHGRMGAWAFSTSVFFSCSGGFAVAAQLACVHDLAVGAIPAMPPTPHACACLCTGTRMPCQDCREAAAKAEELRCKFRCRCRCLCAKHACTSIGVFTQCISTRSPVLRAATVKQAEVTHDVEAKMAEVVAQAAMDRAFRLDQVTSKYTGGTGGSVTGSSTVVAVARGSKTSDHLVH
jgi:hypothetical protein